MGKEWNAHRPLNNITGLGTNLLETPRILFSVAVLAKAGIRQVMVGAGPECVARLHALIGDGDRIGTEISYLVIESDSSIETALHAANRYIANASVLLATPQVCCLNFNLDSIITNARNTISSFRMRCAESDAITTRPDLLHLGNGVLIRLYREAGHISRGTIEVDQLRRALMSRFKYLDVDLTDRCMFVNLENDITIDSSLLNEAALQDLLDHERQEGGSVE